MLLALWPIIFTRNNAHSGGTLIEPDITHRAIRGKAIIERTAAMVAAEAHLQRLQEVDDGSSIAGNADGALDIPSVSGSIIPIGNATIRVPRHERELSGRLPEALGASLAASDAFPSGLDAAMKAYAAKQAADEDDEMAMIIILAGM